MANPDLPCVKRETASAMRVWTAEANSRCSLRRRNKAPRRIEGQWNSQHLPVLSSVVRSEARHVHTVAARTDTFLRRTWRPLVRIQGAAALMIPAWRLSSARA